MKLLGAFTLICFITACSNSDNEKPLEQLDKKSAREVTLMTVKQGDSVLHITRQYIWLNGEKIAEQYDTLKTANSLPSWGEDNSKQTLSEVPIYVTVQ